MSKPKPKVKKTCFVCGREFFTAKGWQITCGNPECTKEKNRIKMREHYEKYGHGTKAHPFQSKAKTFTRKYVSRVEFERMKAEIFAPIPDDKPLRDYI